MPLTAADGPPWLDPGLILARTERALALRRSRQAVALGRAADVTALLDGPGSHVFALTKGQFSQIDLIEAALDLTGPADLALWTWCVADYELLRLSDLCADARLTGARLVVDRAGALRQRHFLAWWLRRFGPDSLRVTRNHAKIATVRGGGRSICIRGSMNLNENPRMEQADVSDDACACALVEACMAELWRAVPAPLARQLDAGECSAAFAEAFAA